MRNPLDILIGVPGRVKVAPGVTTIALPVELTRLDQWVGYQLPSKVPVNPRTGQNAQPNNPGTWGTFAEAIDARLRFGLAGVGIVLTMSDYLVAVDFDKCRDAKTGEIDPDVWREVCRLGSYTEVSPSGTGLHVIARGRKPGPVCKVGRLEMYENGRYLALTGRHVDGTVAVVLPAAREIEDLYNRKLKPAEPAPSKYREPGPEQDGDWSSGARFPEGGRNIGLFRLASAMRGHGLELGEVESELLAANAARCVPPLPDGEVRAIAQGVCRRYPAGRP